MASSRRIDAKIKLSPREARLVSALQELASGDWAENVFFCSHEFGSNPKDWPLNARHIISGALNSLQRKLEYHCSKVVLLKRGNGGRAGIEYQLSPTKGTR